MYNGYLYVFGGQTVSTVYSTKINADGTVGAWARLPNLPQTLYAATAAVSNGYIFITGGHNGTAATSTVYSAPLQSTAFAFNTTNTWATGNLVDVWNNGSSKLSLDNSGNLSIGGKFTSNVVPSGDGLTGSYSTLSTLPVTMRTHSTVASNGYLFVTGGRTGAAVVSTVYSAKINSDGTIGSFATLSTLPAARWGHSTVAYNGYLFVTGGTPDDSTATSTVYSAQIKPDGTVGAWATLSTLPAIMYAHSAVAGNGYLFVTGGYNGTSSLSTVYSAKINSDGTIGAWATLSTLPAALRYLSTTAYNGYLFVTGGGAAAVSTVYSAPINSDGTIGAWATLTNLPTPVYYHTSGVYNGYIYVMGGYDDHLSPPTAIFSTVYSAPIKSDGTIGAWNTLSTMPAKRYAHSATLYNGYLFVTGGWDSTDALTSTVYSASLNTSRAFVFNTSSDYPYGSPVVGGSASLFTVQNNGDSRFNVDAQGNGRFLGSIYAQSAILGTPGGVGDLAENMEAADESIEAGDVVSISSSVIAIPSAVEGEAISLSGIAVSSDIHRSPRNDNGGSGKLVKSSKPYDNSVIGVISTKPSLTFSPDLINGKPVALSGRVPVKVSNENGEIKPGDFLTSSSIPGVAMKATKPGQVIGKALEGFSGEAGTQCPVSEQQKTTLSSGFLIGGSTDSGISSLSSNISLPQDDNNVKSGGKENRTPGTMLDGLEPQPATPTPSPLCGKVLVFVNTTYADPTNILASLTIGEDGNVLGVNNVIARSDVTSERGNLAYQEIASSGSASLTIPRNDTTSFSEVATKLKEMEERVNQLTTQPINQPTTLSVQTEATLSGILSAYSATISETFKALGEVFLGKTTIAGDLSIDGTLSLSEDSINSMDTLFLQSSPLSSLVDLFNGSVIIDKDGNIKTKGVLSAQKIEVSDQTAGTTQIKAGTTKIIINSTTITEHSKVFVTPNKPVFIGVTNLDATKQEFTVELENQPTEDIKFDWWIVDSR